MSYYVITYDVSEQRVNKVRKILKKYFVWVQNSVFEGEASLGKFEKCKQELLRVIDQRRIRYISTGSSVSKISTSK